MTLYLGRSYILTAHFEHVFQPRDVGEPAFWIQGPEVTGVKPAFGIESFGSGFRVLVVTSKDRPASVDDLAELTVR